MGDIPLYMKKILPYIRRVHLYLGVFFAPLLILFAVTGSWQTVTENRNKGYGTTLIERLSTVHIDQYYPAEGVRSYKPKAFKILTVIMAVSLLLTLATGILMGYFYSPRKWVFWLVLLLGILLPALILWLSQSPGPGTGTPRLLP